MKANWIPATPQCCAGYDRKADWTWSRVSKAEQTNSSVIYGDRLMLKFFRKIEPGVNPELEIGRFLMEPAISLFAAAGRRPGLSQPRRRACHGGCRHLVCAGMQRRLGIHGGHAGPVLRAGPNLPRKTARVRRYPQPPLSGWRRQFPKEAAELIGSYLQDSRLLGPTQRSCTWRWP